MRDAMAAVYIFSTGVVSYLVTNACIQQTQDVEMFLVLVQIWWQTGLYASPWHSQMLPSVTEISCILSFDPLLTEICIKVQGII